MFIVFVVWRQLVIWSKVEYNRSPAGSVVMNRPQGGILVLNRPLAGSMVMNRPLAGCVVTNQPPAAKGGDTSDLTCHSIVNHYKNNERLSKANQVS